MGPSPTSGQRSSRRRRRDQPSPRPKAGQVTRVLDTATRELSAGRARQAAWLFVAAGLFTIVNDYLPGSEHLDTRLLDAVGVAAIAIGLLARVLPWHRWPGQATLVFAPMA